MIQYIALALALDAESKSSSANKTSKKALKRSNEFFGDPFVILRPCLLQSVFIGNPKNFWQRFVAETKNVLLKIPFGTYSVRRSDILNLQERTDDDGNKYVLVEVTDSADIWYDNELKNHIKIPGTIEQVTKILNVYGNSHRTT